MCISKFSVDTHIYTSWKIVKKNPKNLSNLDIFDTQYVHLCLSLENMFFLFKFWQILDLFDTLYTECIQTLFLKNFYHIFLILIFHKILFLPDLTMKIWKYTHIYITIYYVIYFKIIAKNFVKFLTNLHIFVTQYVHLCFPVENNIFLSKFWPIFANFDTLYIYYILTIFY